MFGHQYDLVVNVQTMSLTMKISDHLRSYIYIYIYDLGDKGQDEIFLKSVLQCVKRTPHL